MKNTLFFVFLLLVIGVIVFFTYVDYHNRHNSYLHVYEEGDYQYLEYKPSPVEFDIAVKSQLNENDAVLSLLEKNYEYIASDCRVILKYGTYLYKIKCAV